MKKFTLIVLTAFVFSIINLASAAADMEINTPAIAKLKDSMQARHGQLAPHYASGAVGIGRNGMIAVRDANAVPLKDRGAMNNLVAAENSDRAALYKEIAAANGHPEWSDDVRNTFAQRWMDKAQSGWWVESAGGWAKK